MDKVRAACAQAASRKLKQMRAIRAGTEARFYRGLQGETKRTAKKRHIQRRMCKVHDGHRRSGRGPPENGERRRPQRLCCGLIRNELGLAQYRRFVVAELEAVCGWALVAFVVWFHGKPTTLRCATRPGHAGICDPDEERKKPRPENQGAERFTMTA